MNLHFSDGQFDRRRLSPLFSAYIAVTVVFCLLQASGQILAFRNDNTASSLFTSIIQRAKIPRRFAYLLPNSSILLCDDIRVNNSCRIGGSTPEVMVSPVASSSPTSSATTMAVTSTNLAESSVAIGSSAWTATTIAVTSTSLGGLSNSPVADGSPLLTVTISAVPSITRGELSSSTKADAATTPEGLSSSPVAKGTPELTVPISVVPSIVRGGLSSSPVSMPNTLNTVTFPQPNKRITQGPITTPFRYAKRHELSSKFGSKLKQVSQSRGCVESLAWPDIIYRAARREDLTLMALPIWVIAMSIIRNSIAHLVAALLGNCAGLGWSISQAILAEQFSKAYYTAITVTSSEGIELRSFAALQKSKRMLIGAIISGVFLPALMFLSYKILQIYWHQSFQRVDASKEVYSSYRLAVVFCVSLQLAGFFLISSSLLWFNESLAGVIRKYLGSTATIYLRVLSCVGASIPWIIMGNSAVFHERRTLMLRYTLLTWPFFASLSILSFIFLLASTFLGMFCRFNFRKGLEQHLRVLAELDDTKLNPIVFPRDPDMVEALRPAARHSVVLAGIDRPASTSSSHDELDADSLTLARSSSHLSGNSVGTRVTVVSWSSWLWSRGVAALSPSHMPSPTRKSTTPSSDIPTSRISSYSSTLA
ncbi:hypothetical protein BD410DRAFT_840409 [Rickenella mellea]|uniref:Uncharacterized protein n=1 Tax=Rickenella mellea TaxID=50990 RepID=A0A4Y7Q4A0_9AGAM|nr:hypothetical protein BD410DRAFT_840409 [Rickenella mellea]